MYIALAIMFFCMVLGRILAKHIPGKLVHKAIMFAVLLLLYLLGVAIGHNDSLFARLPELGGQALLLMLFCVAGSIICGLLIQPFLGNLLEKTPEKRHDDGK